MENLKTKFFSDVKISVKAGMQFGTKNYQIKKIGYDLFRHYYDSKEKDMQVGSEKIKRVLTY